jgi:hypothetical protein
VRLPSGSSESFHRMPTDTLIAETIDIALVVARAIERVGGEYFVGGSVASSLQGEPRATNDIDFVIKLSPDAVGAFAAALHRAGSSNIFYLPYVTKIDLFGLGERAFDVSEFARRRLEVVTQRGDELFIKSPEDTVVRKLLWYREGGENSTKQWRDLVEVLRISSVSNAYLDEWAARLGLDSLLAKARRDVSP